MAFRIRQQKLRIGYLSCSSIISFHVISCNFTENLAGGSRVSVLRVDPSRVCVCVFVGWVGGGGGWNPWPHTHIKTNLHESGSRAKDINVASGSLRVTITAFAPSPP